MGNVSTIVDEHGQPFARVNGSVQVRDGVRGQERLKSLVSTLNQWWSQSLAQNIPAEQKARAPLNHHPWVFAAAMAIATTSTQAPYTVFRETETALEARRRQAVRARVAWKGPRAGARRRALQRYAAVRRVLRSKGLEPVLDHPIYDLLQAPNPLQRGDQLMMMTVLWMAYRGESFWAFTDEEGRPLSSPLDVPAMIWPLSPDLFTPIFERGERGTLVGWELCTPRFMPSAVASSPRLRFPLHSIVQMKLPNPDDLVRGFARLTPVMGTITSDLLAKDFMRYLLENRAMIGGILEYDGSMKPDEENDIREKFKRRHQGPRNAGELMILQGGLKYNPTSMTPTEMGVDSSYEHSREEVLGVLGTPPTALGLQDVANYATAQVFDRSFWEKGIMPLLRSIESAVDGSLLFGETDDTVGMFDTSNVEAFRAGIADKVAIAKSMSDSSLHVPPRTAFEVAGLDVPEFEGDDVALVGAAMAPLKDVLAPPEPVAATPAGGNPGPGAPPPAPTPGGEDDAAVTVARGIFQRASKRARWAAFVKVQSRLESAMRRGYRAWIGAERRAALDRLDAEAKRVGLKAFRKASQLNVGAVLGDPKKARDALKAKTRPVYATGVQETYDFTLDDVNGVPVFGIDDERIMQVLDVREKRLLDTVPSTVRKNLNRSLSEGVQAGETLAQLRVRVGEVFNVAASSAKSLQVARTEVAGLMNGVRDQMFEAQGFTKLEWVTAGDENVRESHVDFGSAGAQDRGFDYLTLLSEKKSGTLRFPGDPSGPADEVINCRCLQIPG